MLVLATTVGGNTWAGNDVPAQERDVHNEVPWVEQGPGWTVMIVPLRYANAEELAAVLAPILPRGVVMVPYAPTNSLIIWGRSQPR